ncbi:2-hydroxychromene-2-carboxylate isomerase [Novosphingobium sp.]|uniref:2-hydroxychromene-2-carboxylate isomerase n=1 Tax=Novosphingobium sp. TaxID=1874826 RepID=UPI00333FBA37
MTAPATRRVIEFLFDFASPNAYLVWKVLPDLAARHNAEVRLVPCLLGGMFRLTGNQAPMLAFGAIKGKMEYERLEMQRFIDSHGLTAFRMNPHFPVNTLVLMRGLIAARRMGVEPAYVAAGLVAMWEQGLAMDDPAVIAAVLDTAGLDSTAILAATHDAETKAELVAATEAAVARGAFGIPTFFVDGEMYFGKERLAQIAQQLAG